MVKVLACSVIVRDCRREIFDSVELVLKVLGPKVQTFSIPAQVCPQQCSYSLKVERRASILDTPPSADLQMLHHACMTPAGGHRG